MLVLQDDPVAGQPIKTSGSGTIAHALIVMAGGRSVFTDVSSMHADISPEQVVQRDPQVLWLISDYPFAKAKGQELADRVRKNPLLAGTSAVEHGRVVSTSQYLVSFPSPLNLDGLEQLATDMHAGGT
ncbi:ABC transporter substrate-binding protein [Thermocatellispora tengchongensis]|uniref:ABC transporter substrate-binding protein n=1 Tax=Thermocatellispora tengchongensis TaxID=1073253 RepID=UPI00362976F2